MKLREFPLLADENVHPEVIAALRAEGFDLVAVRETDLVGSEDVSLIRLAAAQGRAILTHDSDFGTLAFAGGEPYIGIVYLRPGHIVPAFTQATLRTLLAQEVDLQVPFIIVAQRSGDRVKIRVRRG